MSDAGRTRPGASTEAVGCLVYLWRFFCHSLFLGFLVSLTVRLLFQDTLPHPGAILFYLTPLPILGALALPEFLLQFSRRHRSGAIATGLCFLLPICQWLGTSYRHLSDPAGIRDPRSVRLVFWTADNYKFTTIPEAAEALAQLDADVLILNEGVIDLGTQKRVFGDRFPDHEVVFLPWDRFALVRGRLLAQHFSHTRWMDGTLVQLVIESGEHSFIALLFDHRSDPDVSRGHAIGELSGAVSHLSGQPLLLMGDFNTPSDSAYLKPISKLLADAFDLAGSGFKETWPVPVPLLTLDQLWLSPSISVSRTYHTRLGRSYHEAIVVDFIPQTPIDTDRLNFPAPYPSNEPEIPDAAKTQ